MDLGHVLDPSERDEFPGENISSYDRATTIFSLAFFVKPNSAEHLLRTGVYEIDFQVYAANAPPSKVFTFFLDHRGKWFPNEDQMFKDGLWMRIAEK